MSKSSRKSLSRQFRYLGVSTLSFVSDVLRSTAELTDEASEKIAPIIDLSGDTLLRTRIHEAGHAILATVLPELEGVYSVRVDRLGKDRSWGKVVSASPSTSFKNYQYFLQDIALAYGGLVAEKEKFGDHQAGVVGDIKNLSEIAHDMVVKYGMSGMPIMNYEINQPNWLLRVFKSHAQPVELPEPIKIQIHDEKEKILSAALALAEENIKKYWKAVEAVAKRLEDVDEIDGNELNSIIRKLYPEANINEPLQEL